MYPCLTLSYGFRFQEPLEMELGAATDHIMIGGRNGSSKTTWSLAGGAALGSNMVAVESLRDSALPPQRPWHANFTWVFHNPPGDPDRPNADEYVAVRLTIEQGPVGRHGTRPAPSLLWEILEGPRLGPPEDRLVEITVRERYTERTKLQSALRNRFAIDPDLYAMFWHQAQITRFVDLSDADKAAEMLATFDLERLETAWHEARDACRKAWERLQDAKSAKDRNQVALDAAESQYRTWQTKRAKIGTALARYWGATNALRQLLEAQEQECKSTLSTLTATEATAREEATAAGQEGFEYRAEENRLAACAAAAEAEQQQLLAMKDADLALVQRLDEQIRERRRELEGLLQRRGTLRPRTVLTDRETDLTARQSALQQQQAVQETAIAEADQLRSGLLVQQGAMQKDAARITGQLADLREELDVLAPAAELQAELARWKIAERQSQAEQHLLTEERNRAKRELDGLAGRTGTLHPLQLDSIRRAGGWSLGALLQVRPGVNEGEAERQLGAIKHGVVTPGPLPEPGAPVYHLALDHPWLPPLAGPTAADLVSLAAVLPPDLPATAAESIGAWLKTVALAPDRAAAAPLLAAGYLTLLPDGTLLDRHGDRGPLAHEPALGPQALENARLRLAATVDRCTKRLGVVANDLVTAADEVRQYSRHLDTRERLEATLPELADLLAEASEQLPLLASDIAAQDHKLAALRQTLTQLVGQSGQVTLELEQVRTELAVHAELDRVNDQVQELEGWETEHAAHTLAAENHRKRGGEAGADAERLRREAGQWRDLADDAERRRKAALDQAEEAIAERTRTQKRLTRVLDRLLEEHQGRDALWAQYGTQIASLDAPPDSEPDADPDQLRSELEAARLLLQVAEDLKVPDDADQIFFQRQLAHRQREEDFVGATAAYDTLRRDEKKYRDRFRNSVQNYHQAVDQRFREFLERVGLRGHIALVPPPQMDESDAEGRPAVLGRAGYQWQLWVATLDRDPELVPAQTSRSRTKTGEGPSGGERAAISLVHALAMLSTLSVRPCFYVMDEFDSALDETNKRVLIDLFTETLQRKLIVISPKAAAKDYLQRFALYYCYLRRSDGRAEAVGVSLDRFAEIAKQVREEES